MLLCVAEFAIVDEAYPFVAKMLLTDDSPRLRSALKYMVYGKDSVFDADRLIDLLAAFEDFSVASKSAQGNMDVGAPRPGSSFKLPSQPGKAQTADLSNANSMSNRHVRSQNAAGVSNARTMSNGQASTSTAYSQNGTSSAMPRNVRPGSWPYSSNGAGKTAGAGTYASVDGYGSLPAANGQGNAYSASIDNKPQRTESNGLAQFDRQLDNRSGASATGFRNGNGVRPAEARTGMQVPGGQGKLVGSERAVSEQHASTSNGGPWGSWGSWPPQVIHCTSEIPIAALSCTELDWLFRHCCFSYQLLGSCLDVPQSTQGFM